jgi:hypothetical protein
MAHYDTVLNTTTILDNSSALALILSNIEKLHKCKPHLEFVFTDGEELGGKGSELYCKNAISKKDKIKFIANFDIIGFGDSVVFSCNKLIPESLMMLMLASGGELDTYPFCDYNVISKYFPSFGFITNKKGGWNKNGLECFSHFHGGINDKDFSSINPEVIKKVQSILYFL